jgi:cytochrome c-type biogenesis protein CcmH
LEEHVVRFVSMTAVRRLTPRPSRVLATLVVAVALLAVAAIPALAADLTPEQEELAKKLEHQLIAPCCWTQTVDVHSSESAELMKAQISMLVAQGKSESEILDTFVEQYGEPILAAPRASGFNLVAYVLPVVIALAAAGAIAYLVVRWRRRPDEPEVTVVPARVTDASHEPWLCPPCAPDGGSPSSRHAT